MTNGRRPAAAPQSVDTCICCPFSSKRISGLNAGHRILSGLSGRLLFRLPYNIYLVIYVYDQSIKMLAK